MKNLYIIKIALVLILSACGNQKNSVTPNSFERKIKLDGQNNFRDLGNYSTENGHKIKEGVLFRSGTLSELTTSQSFSVEIIFS